MTTDVDRVSAYLPCWNNEPTLERVIRSIQRQTHPVDEILVVDDGSTDATAAIAASLGAHVVCHPRNLGRGAARARAMEEVKHDLVLSCDGTKPVHEDFVEGALRWFRDDTVAAVFGALQQPAPTSVAHRWRGRHLFRHSSAFPSVSSRCLATWGTMVRRSIVLSVGNYDAGRPHNEDGDLGARLLARGYQLISDPDLRVVEVAEESVARVLERHWRWGRWNRGRGDDRSWGAYVRTVARSLTMAREDLQEGDLLAVPISLISPHYRFWRTRWSATTVRAVRRA